MDCSTQLFVEKQRKRPSSPWFFRFKVMRVSLTGGTRAGLRWFPNEFHVEFCLKTRNVRSIVGALVESLVFPKSRSSVDWVVEVIHLDARFPFTILYSLLSLRISLCSQRSAVFSVSPRLFGLRKLGVCKSYEGPGIVLQVP